MNLSLGHQVILLSRRVLLTLVFVQLLLLLLPSNRAGIEFEKLFNGILRHRFEVLHLPLFHRLHLDFAHLLFWLWHWLYWFVLLLRDLFFAFQDYFFLLLFFRFVRVLHRNVFKFNVIIDIMRWILRLLWLYSWRTVGLRTLSYASSTPLSLWLSWYSIGWLLLARSSSLSFLLWCLLFFFGFGFLRFLR